MTPAEHEQARQVAERAVGLNRTVAFPLSAEQADVLARCYLELTDPPYAETNETGGIFLSRDEMTPEQGLAFDLGFAAGKASATPPPLSGEQRIELLRRRRQERPEPDEETRAPADDGADHGGTTAE